MRQPALGPKRRILVVDDNRDGADSLALMLRLLGNEVRTAHNGLEALEQTEAFRPQAILMDVRMAKLNGLEATRRIREQEWGRGVTIIAVTGWGQEGDRERSRESGCDGRLVKPMNLPDLQRLLRELEERKEGRGRLEPPPSAWFAPLLRLAATHSGALLPSAPLCVAANRKIDSG
jgi:CheY-like chemotaxis protein